MLYRLTAALLIAHEIDSGYWHEWEVLRLPGGIALYLALHVPITMAVLWGGERLALRERAGRLLAVAVGAAGLLTVVVHAALLRAGSLAFATPTSIVIIGLAGASGVGLLVAVGFARDPSARPVARRARS